MSSRIFVAIRKRPLSRSERDKGGQDVVDCNYNSLVVSEHKVRYDLSKYVEQHNYQFDRVFAEHENNSTVFRDACHQLLETVYSAGNATCFAYGQTGSGKTHTMLGKGDDPGIYLLASEEIFRRHDPSTQGVYLAFYEIYGRKIFDLLNERNRLVAREDADKNINICGLTEHRVTAVEELMQLMAVGSSQRAAGVTAMNSDSSRSHAVLRIEIKKLSNMRTFGTMSFIDLAGNERGTDTMDCDRQTRVEGAEINRSLLALKECIRALGMGKGHVPFRGSVLTEVLRDSFLGNSRTVMIANISPSSTNCEHTLNTLRYTDRVKELRSDKPKGRGRRSDADGPKVLAGRRAERDVAKAAPKQKQMNEDVLQIIRKIRPEIAAQQAREGGNDDDDDDDDEEKEVEKCYTHVAAALSQEQEDLLVNYRRMLDSRVQLMLEETEAIQQLDKGGVRDLDDFVKKIDHCLSQNIQKINGMRDRLAQLKEHLRQEEVLGKSFRPTFRV